MNTDVETNAESTPDAIASAAERYLGDLKVKRVQRAEAELAKARDRLAEAEATLAEAAEAVTRHESNATRAAVVEAEGELVIARNTLPIYEKRLATAKGRWSDEMRAVALDRVTKEREWLTCQPKREAIKGQIAEAARELIRAARELENLTLHQQGLSIDLRHAMEVFGERVENHHYLTPDNRIHIADAIAGACKAESYGVYVWRDHCPTYARGGAVYAVPAARAVIDDNRREQQHARNDERRREVDHDIYAREQGL